MSLIEQYYKEKTGVSSSPTEPNNQQSIGVDTSTPFEKRIYGINSISQSSKPMRPVKEITTTPTRLVIEKKAQAFQ
jgi:hypothetical protein